MAGEPVDFTRSRSRSCSPRCEGAEIIIDGVWQKTEGAAIPIKMQETSSAEAASAVLALLQGESEEVITNLDGGDWGRNSSGGPSSDGIMKSFDVDSERQFCLEHRGWYLHCRQPIVMFAGTDPIGFLAVSIFNTQASHKDNWAAYLGEERFAVNTFIYVKRDRRRQGLARRLVDRAHELAVAQGALYSLVLVAERNNEARGVYKQLGFVEKGVFMKGEIKMLTLECKLGIQALGLDPLRITSCLHDSAAKFMLSALIYEKEEVQKRVDGMQFGRPLTHQGIVSRLGPFTSPRGFQYEACTCFLAQAPLGTAIGHCATAQNMDGRLFVMFLYVCPTARNKGVGAALVRHAVAEAHKSLLCRSVNVAVSKEAEMLHRFYCRLGFRGEGGREFSDGAPMAIWTLCE